MFDRVARRYDRANHLLSLWRDVTWRRQLARHLPIARDVRVLDLATGTGDLLIALATPEDRSSIGTPSPIRLALGVDMSPRMLEIAQRKVRHVVTSHGRLQPAGPHLRLVRADATRLAVASASMDAVTMGFGIRNVTGIDAALSEALRVLRPGGRLLILEFSLPTHALIRVLYLLYLRRVLPVFGALLTGQGDAYRYLARTIETFPYGEALCARIRSAGFTAVHTWPLTLGIAAIYQADRPL